MDRQEIMEHVAEWFGIEPDEDGNFDINDYDWQAGCSMMNGKWLNLEEIVKCIENLV